MPKEIVTIISSKTLNILTTMKFSFHNQQIKKLKQKIAFCQGAF